jgi:hypothetical protein
MIWSGVARTGTSRRRRGGGALMLSNASTLVVISQAKIDEVCQSCYQVGQFNECLFVWFFIVAFLFYLLRDAIMYIGIPKEARWALSRGLLIAFKLLMILGVMWWAIS